MRPYVTIVTSVKTVTPFHILQREYIFCLRPEDILNNSHPGPNGSEKHSSNFKGSKIILEK